MKLGIPLDKFVVFGDGQVQERKGIDDLLKWLKLILMCNLFGWWLFIWQNYGWI